MLLKNNLVIVQQKSIYKIYQMLWYKLPNSRIREIKYDIVSFKIHLWQKYDPYECQEQIFRLLLHK